MSNDRRSGAFEGDIQVDGPAWIVARAVSDVASPLVFDLYPFATTSPVYVATPGAGLTSTQDADFFIAWIAKLKATAEAGEYNTAEERKAVLDRLDAAARAFEARR